jgi:hypothetical protein
MEILVNKESVICRGCDLPMEFEEENPEGYFLFKCLRCKTDGREVRVGLIDKDAYTGNKP